MKNHPLRKYENIHDVPDKDKTKVKNILSNHQPMPVEEIMDALEWDRPRRTIVVLHSLRANNEAGVTYNRKWRKK